MRKSLRPHKHKLNVVGVIIGLAVFFLAVAELNNLCAPRIDFSPSAVREIFSAFNWHWYLCEGAWYNMMLWTLGIGLLVFGLSLWFWED